MSRGVHRLGLRLFVELWCGSYWLLNHFFNEKLNKIENQKLYCNLGGCSWCCWKALYESDLIEFISQFSELRCERNQFCWWKFKQIAKNWVWMAKSVEPLRCVHTLAGNSNKLQKIGFGWQNWSSPWDVFTLWLAS